MLLRTISIFLLVFLLGACSDDVNKAKQLLDENTPNRSEINYRDIHTFDGDVVCGEYNAELFRGSSNDDYFRFLTVGQTLYVRPNTQQWDIFCSDTPAEALLEQTGIGLFDAGNTELAKITQDLSSLSLALEAYYKAHFVYPTGEQGLEALVSPPANLAAPSAYPQGGYLKAIPLDPWGRPYVYEEEQWGRTKGHFTISTTGADGVVGGGGKNADVSTAVLPYLRHIADVLEQQ
ncbi:MAG: type II secretion system protein GspG [Halioglobus sp.]